MHILFGLKMPCVDICLLIPDTMLATMIDVFSGSQYEYL